MSRVCVLSTLMVLISSGLDLDVFALGKRIAAALVILLDDLSRFLVDHLLPQAVAGLAIDLVEVGFLGLARRRVERNRAGHERELEVALPIGTTRGDHGVHSAEALGGEHQVSVRVPV